MPGADFEAVAAIGGLDEEHIVAGEPQHALHRCGHVFMQTVGEFNYHHRSASRCPHEAPRYNATTFAPKFP
jgi:hypothetical protein